MDSLGYTTHDVSKLLGLTPRQIRSLVAEEFLQPNTATDGDSRYSFQDIVLLRAAKGLHESNIPPRRIRSALKGLIDQLPDGLSATSVRITAVGNEVVVRDGEQAWNPESGQVLFDFAVAELQGASGPVERVQPLEEPTPDEAGPTDAEAWFELACELEATDVEESLAAYRRTLELHADHPDAHLNLGRLLHERGELSAAERHYRHALRVAPGDSTAAFNLGVALEDLGRPDDALKAYRTAFESDPEYADAFYNAANLYEARGDKAEALRCLKSYRQLTGS